MNILIYSWRGIGHPRSGGAEIVTHEYAKRWVKMGHQVTIFTSWFHKGKNFELVDGIRYIRYGTDLSFTVQFYALRWYLFKTTEQFDVVMDHFHGLPFFTPWYVRAPKAAFIHEVATRVWRFNPLPRPLSQIPAIVGPNIEPLIFKYIYNNIPFITISNSTKADIIEFGIPKKEITVVPDGVNLIKYKNLPNKERKKTLIYLGAVTKDKGVEDAIGILYLLNKYDEYQLWVVGKGDKRYIKSLKDYIKKSKIKGVKFFGFISEKRKFSLLARARLLINPSQLEGWGLVVIEAASVGTPTVGYNVPGLRDSIKHNKTGLLVKPSVKAAVESILKLMQDEKKYRQLSKQAIEWSVKFDWDKSARKILKIIEKQKPHNPTATF